MFDDVWNVLNSSPLAMSNTHLPCLFLTHHQLQDLQFVTHLPAKQNPTNWDVAASKYGVPSVFDLLHLVAFVCFLFLLEKFWHQIDNIIVISWWGYSRESSILSRQVEWRKWLVTCRSQNKMLIHWIPLFISIMVLFSCVSQKTISWYRQTLDTSFSSLPKPWRFEQPLCSNGHVPTARVQLLFCMHVTQRQGPGNWRQVKFTLLTCCVSICSAYIFPSRPVILGLWRCDCENIYVNGEAHHKSQL